MEKILYVASTYGHIKSFHLQYIKELLEKGYEVHIAAHGVAGIDKDSTFKDITFIDIPFEKRMFSIGNFCCAIMLKKQIQNERYSIISVHTSLAAFFTRIAALLSKKDRPVVINTVHGYLFDENTSTIKKNVLILAEKLTKKATDVLVVMNNQDYDLAKKYGLYKNKLIKINGYGIDCKRFSRENVLSEILKSESFEDNTDQIESNYKDIRGFERNKLGFSKEDILLIYAAEFSNRKNQKMLIRAMDGLPDNVKLLLAGKGQTLEECKQLSASLGYMNKENINYKMLEQRVFFLGHISNLEYYYFISDICVSSSRSEGLPFNIMEAMAMGLPVVATKVKGHEDLIEDGVNGFLYDYDKDSQYEAAVIKMSDNIKTGKCVKIEQDNINKAHKYAIENVKNDILRILSSI
ncbi:MAG: glycosyltransferase [Aminipila sp.]